MVPPEHLGFSVSDDIIAPRSGIPVRPLQPADAAEPAEQPDVDVIPAAEDAEPPVEAREDGMEHHEVWVDGVKLDTNSPLRTLRAACDSLGLSKTGGKTKCLKRLWNHLQAQELLAAHAAHHQLQSEVAIHSLCQMNLQLKNKQGTALRTSRLRLGVSFVLHTVLFKIHTKSKSIQLLHIHVFLSTLDILRDLLVKILRVHFTFMTEILALCM